MFFKGIAHAHYDANFRSHHQLCLSIFKRFGFGRRVMESRILLEVEMMLKQVRKENGRPFDMEHLTTSCVANVVMNMMFGHRFDHFDATYQQLLSDLYDILSTLSVFPEIFPVLRFLPYFKTILDKQVLSNKKVQDAVEKNIAICTEVCVTVLLCIIVSALSYSVIYSYNCNWYSKYRPNGLCSPIC